MKACYYAGLLLCGVFISAISQVLLKKAAQRQNMQQVSSWRKFFECSILYLLCGHYCTSWGICDWMAAGDKAYSFNNSVC